MIKTMAVKITEENYPIAVACLGAGFATTNKQCTIGAYLVINDWQYPDFSQPGYIPRPPRVVRYDAPIAPPRQNNMLVLKNFWTSKVMFKEEFKAVGEVTDKTSFFEVTRK